MVLAGFALISVRFNIFVIAAQVHTVTPIHSMATVSDIYPMCDDKLISILYTFKALITVGKTKFQSGRTTSTNDYYDCWM